MRIRGIEVVLGVGILAVVLAVGYAALNRPDELPEPAPARVGRPDITPPAPSRLSEGIATFARLQFLALVMVLSLALAVLPIGIAIRRRHPNTAPIVVIALALGWTYVGWVAALAWSLTSIDRGRAS